MKRKKDSLVNSYFDDAQYLAFGGLTRNPFPLAPDDSGFFSTAHIEKIISSFLHAMLSQKGFMLFTGGIGLGKTTITRRIISKLGEHRIETALILNSFYQEDELLGAINKDFGIIQDNYERSTQLELLNEFLLKKAQEDINCAIIIDDAQYLTFESLELIRMISNLEADQKKLVQILLVGQTELLEKIESHDLRQLKSRVAVWERPFALDQNETRRYVRYKLNIAGDTGRILIKKNTLNKLFSLTQGNLRKINIIMDKAMNQAFKNGSLVIHKKYLKDVFSDSKELNGKNSNPYIFILLITLCILIVGWGIGIFIFYQKKIKPQENNKMLTITKRVIPQKSQPPMELSQRRLEKPDQRSTKINKPKIARSGNNTKTGSLEEIHVSQFLSAYGLMKFKEQFKSLLSHGKIKEVRAVIYNKTGLELIQLDTIPEKIQNHYDIFVINEKRANLTGYYLFWFPIMKIQKFYIGYRGQEIKPVQKLLKDTGLYDYYIDGIVGPILINGITQFQRQNNLKVTGFPDPETVFLLNH
ncbi:MAG: AAA family ATPase [Desulfobacteraceae bacterium]|nr:AAA family ATPase [Desulfobacteraceae bacterium]